MSLYAAYIPDLPTPIAMADTKSACLETAIKQLVRHQYDPIVGKTCRELLAGEIGDVNSPKLTIAPFVIS